MSAIKTQSPVVLEHASQKFVEATANPPFLYQLPAEARKVLDDLQATPINKLDVVNRWIAVPAESERCACASSGRRTPQNHFP